MQLTEFLEFPDRILGRLLPTLGCLAVADPQEQERGVIDPRHAPSSSPCTIDDLSAAAA